MEKNSKPTSKVVETYTADMARAIDGHEGIYIKKIIEEQEKVEVERKNLSPESKKNKNFMLLGLFLLFLAFGVFIFFVFLHNTDPGTVEVQKQFSPVIFLDHSEFKEIGGFTKDQITQSVSNEVLHSPVKLGGVEGIYLTNELKLVGLRQLLTLISSELDQSKLNFISDDFLLGATKLETNGTFFLLKIRSLTDVFEAFRQWESSMFYDLHGFFGIDLTPDSKYLLTKDFENGFIQNKNARILKNEASEIVLMYIYVDDTSVLITDNKPAVQELILRLSSSTIKK